MPAGVRLEEPATIVSSGGALPTKGAVEPEQATEFPQAYVVPMRMHKQNRERLCQRLVSAGAPPRSVVVMEGGKEEYRHETDTEKVFRQESSFQYLFGVKEPGFYGVVEVATARCTLYMPRLPAEYAVWMGPIKSPEHFKATYEVDSVRYVDELAGDLGALGPQVVYLNQGTNSDSGSVARPASFEGLGAFKADLEVLYRELAECRVIKSPEELRLMQHVNDISSDAHLEVMRGVRPGMFEYQLESLFLHHGYFRGGCRHSAYISICGCGPNSAVLHYGHAAAPNDRRIGAGDMLLLDMGAEYHCYASDITCSFPASGRFTPDQRAVFEAVQAMQFAVMDALRPGVAWKDMHELAYRVGCEKLRAAGLLKGDVGAMMEANVMAVFMPHGLGHFMGLDVHDVGGYPAGTERDARPGYKSLRTVRVMQPGMVVTVEPGIYFIDLLLDRALADPSLSPFIDAEVLKRFRGFGGVRLEDDVVITETGVHNMTNCPRTVEDVEAVMAGRITHRSQLFKKG